MPRPAEQDASSASSLSRGLALLDLFTAPDQVLSISEIARRSGVPKSTTHRLILDLINWGALERNTKGVSLGVHLFELGSLVPSSSTLRELALPFAHNLNEVTKLTSNIAIREGNDVLYIEKITTRTLKVPHSRVGGRARMHATALGKAILAFSDPEFVGDVLGGPLLQQTEKTITDPAVLRRELARVRAERVAYDVEESRLGLFCVSAPVFNGQGGPVVGAISVTGATELAIAKQFAPAVLATAMALSSAIRTAKRPRRSIVA
ncbi:DNA-binding IclR family transcriptional regulator [Paenarthrobacter nicotinovorans]|uniref:IclR family transcriptional regulator n=1 Tax=Paenarthrobacter nicotinovorans TaxID=29320 RepID=UPI002787E790|nr:IclR family transcriptional regulator [Paenarthrobacter nicotinovorans]MDP9933813.1 DNA-binding IclR family transcriptional regulator [Paenarthrobacter nicotinovorans]